MSAQFRDGIRSTKWEQILYDKSGDTRLLQDELILFRYGESKTVSF